METQELALFEASLNKANQILKLTGLQTDQEDTNKTFLQRIQSRKLFCFLNLQLYMELVGEIAWLFDRGIIHGHFIEATYSLACATFCILGSIKSYYSIKYAHHINDLMYTLRQLQTVDCELGIQADTIAYEAIRKIVKGLSVSINALLIFSLCGLFAFLFGPLIVMGYIFYDTGVVVLLFPFLIYYPFDASDLKIYPFLYVHQMIGGTFAVFTVLGPDCLYYIFCTFVQVQFCALQYEMERIITPNSNLRVKEAREAYQKKFIACVTRHRELMRCVDLIEVIHCKSTLCNFLSSSLLLCLAGFNIVAYENLAMLSNFLSFLIMCLLQIFLICYYGDNVSRSSAELSNTVYKSLWYNVDAKVAKDLLMVLTRAQKPCKLTAYAFAEINLTAFTRILSTSWSYFALLQSVYNR